MTQKRANIVMIYSIIAIIAMSITTEMEAFANHDNVFAVTSIKDPDSEDVPGEIDGNTITRTNQGTHGCADGETYEVKYIVIHASEGTFTDGSIKSFINNTSNGEEVTKSTHYIISNGIGTNIWGESRRPFSDGEIIRMVPDKNTSWTAGVWPIGFEQLEGCNPRTTGPIHHFNTINIEFMGETDTSNWPTAAIYEKGARLVSLLADHYGISKRHIKLGKFGINEDNIEKAKDQTGIIGHDQIKDKSDPCGFQSSWQDTGCTFDWDFFMDCVNHSGCRPPRPSNVNAQAISDTKSRVKWNFTPDPKAPHTGFRVIRRTELPGGETEELVRTVNSEKRSFVDTNLKPNAEYCYQVRAFDEEGDQSDLPDKACIRAGGVSPSPLDVYLLVDLTGSFRDDLPSFKNEAPQLISSLQESNPNIRFGLGKFQDYPIQPFGSVDLDDTAYSKLIDLTSNTQQIVDTISDLSTRRGRGQDEPESQLTALYQAVTGKGQDLSDEGYPEASIPTGQQANFRDNARKLIVLWTDSSFHRPGDEGDIPYPGPTFSKTVEALLRGGVETRLEGAANVVAAEATRNPVKVIGMTSNDDPPDDLRRISRVTGAVAPPSGVDCNADGTIDIPGGQPLVCTIAEATGITEALTSTVEAAPTFVYRNLQISPEIALLGEQIEIRADAHNPLSSLQSESVQLRLGGTPSQSRNLSLGAGESQQIRFVVSFGRDGLGEHTVAIGGLGPTTISVVSINDIIARHTPDCPPGKDNPAKIICLEEMKFATWLYYTDNPVPETGGRQLTRENLRELTTFYVTETQVNHPPPAVESQAIVAQLNQLLNTYQPKALTVSRVLAIPSSARNAQEVQFSAIGTGIESVEVNIYDLAGATVFDGKQVTGKTFTWHLRTDHGTVVANGIYLYRVTVRGTEGQVMRSGVKKLVVLR